MKVVLMCNSNSKKDEPMIDYTMTFISPHICFIVIFQVGAWVNYLNNNLGVFIMGLVWESTISMNFFCWQYWIVCGFEFKCTVNGKKGQRTMSHHTVSSIPLAWTSLCGQHNSLVLRVLRWRRDEYVEEENSPRYVVQFLGPSNKGNGRMDEWTNRISWFHSARWVVIGQGNGMMLLW